MHQQRQHWANWARGERVFHKGDFKYIILDLLKDKPRHGYEIMRELENQFNGFYAPSPGAVYPTLQYLEEMEYVTSEVSDGKKIYTITETGRSFLVEKEKETADIKAQMKSSWGCYGAEFKDEMRDVMRTFGDIGKMIGQKARQAGSEKLPLIKQVLSDAAREIEKIFKA